MLILLFWEIKNHCRSDGEGGFTLFSEKSQGINVEEMEKRGTLQ